MSYDKKKIPINNQHADRRAAGDGFGTSQNDEGMRADSGGRQGDPETASRVTPGAEPGPGAEEGHEAATDRGADAQVDESGATETDQGPGPSPLEALAAERDGFLEALMRLQAEFDNYRRRSQRESSETRTRARAALLGEFLPVYDNLARALDAAEHHEEGKVLEGVRLTHSLFADLLRREGVCEIHPLGSHFDPHLHEAVVSIPSEAEEGIVVQVVEKGYMAGDGVLRPARVVVSSGAPSSGAGSER